MRILVVDDTLISRQLLTHSLRPYGEVDVAVNGEEAVESFRMAWDEKAPYDCIFLDIMMPLMDGHEVLSDVRKWEQDKAVNNPVQIVMSTALGDRENVLNSFKEGCEFYLVKPLQVAKVEGIMAEMGFSKKD